MFEKLQERLSGVFDKLTRRGALTEADVDEAMREVRVALLEADVALPVVKDFVATVREGAIGERVVKSVIVLWLLARIQDALVRHVLSGQRTGKKSEGNNLHNGSFNDTIYATKSSSSPSESLVLKLGIGDDLRSNFIDLKSCL